MEEVEDQVNTFLHHCLHLLRDPKAASKLTQMLTVCMKDQREETTIAALLPERDVCQVSKKKRTSQEFKMTTKLGGYDIDGVMLDLGSELNILPKKSWKVMGKPKLVWSLENVYKDTSA
jgi:hypothetical protein